MSQQTTVQISRELLKQQRVLNLLDDELLSQVMQVSRFHRYAKHENVLRKGSVNDWLGILLRGRLQVIDTLVSGVEVGINFIEAGNFFGEITVIDRQPRSASLMASTECDIIQIPGDVARQLFFRYPPVAEAIQVHLTHVMRRTNELRSLLSMQNVFQRTCALIQYFMRPAPGGLIHIEQMPTHQELAIMVNTSRETVSRALSELSRLGIVEKDGRRLIIREPEQLAALVSAH